MVMLCWARGPGLAARFQTIGVLSAQVFDGQDLFAILSPKLGHRIQVDSGPAS